MSYYSLNGFDNEDLETIGFDPALISKNLFGAQGHYDYDREFSPASPDYGAYVELLKSLNVSDLRFPGGTTTERMFGDETFENGNWLRSNVEQTASELAGKRFFLDDLAEVAAEIGSSVSIVLPTRIAFTQSAGQAMMNGEYGSRTEIRDDYWETLEAFVDDVISQTRAHDVNIRTFEIGNEFWFGGEMSSTEYGSLAGKIVVWLNDKLEGLGVDAQIAVQGISASAMFSPREINTSTPDNDNPGEDSDQDYGPSRMEFYLVEDGIGRNGDAEYRVFQTLSDLEDAYRPYDLLEGEEFKLPEHTAINLFDQASYKDNESSSVQVVQIANGLLNEETEDGRTAADLVDGMILHPYFGSGFGDGSEESGIDSENAFAFGTIFDNFSETLDRTDLTFHATEWSTRYKNYEDFEGVQTTIEAFFELASNGVDFANYWPTTFGGKTPTDRVLVQTSEGDLTFPGVTFQLLSESVIGLKTLFDYDIHGAIDIHGFGSAENNEKLVVFVGERSGQEQSDVTLDLGEFAFEHDYFLVATTLGSEVKETVGSKGAHYITVPTLIYSDGGVVTDDDTTNIETLEFGLNALGTARLELTAITKYADTITGRGGDDIIEGRGGQDHLSGAGGNDSIFGGESEDLIYGGDGDDYISGGSQADSIFAGAGNDTVWGDFGRDVIDLGEGDDVFYDNDQKYHYGEDSVDGGDGDDRLYGAGGNDTLSGGSGNDSVFGGVGDDFLFGGSGLDILEGGKGADTFVFKQGSGNDTVLDFELGVDVLDVIGWSVGSFAELTTEMYDGYVMIGFGSDSIRLNGIDSMVGMSDADFAFLRHIEAVSAYSSVVKSVPDVEVQKELGTPVGQNSGFENTDIVKELYRSLLGRDYDEGQVSDSEITSWTTAMDTGSTQSDIVDAISKSAEYKNKSLSDDSVQVEDSNSTEWSDDVYRLYRATLDRNPDPLGFDYWTDRLSDGVSYQTTVAGFTSSTEFKNTYGNLSDTEFVSLLYNNVLDRDASSDEINDWLNEITLGSERTEVVTGFAQSKEFQNNTADDLKAWMRAQGVDNVIDSGLESSTLSGSKMADTFMFNKADTGTHHVMEFELWDFVGLNGFGYANASEARTYFVQTGSSVVFADQGTEITFENATLEAFEDDSFIF